MNAMSRMSENMRTVCCLNILKRGKGKNKSGAEQRGHGVKNEKTYCSPSAWKTAALR